VFAWFPQLLIIRSESLVFGIELGPRMQLLLLPEFCPEVA